MRQGRKTLGWLFYEEMFRALAGLPREFAASGGEDVLQRLWFAVVDHRAD